MALATHATGDWAIIFLMLSLAMTPARTLFDWMPLVHVRRRIGVAAALYAWQYYRSRHRRVALMSLKRVHAALEQGAEPVGSSLDEHETYIKSEVAKWIKVVKQAGIEPQ